MRIVQKRAENALLPVLALREGKAGELVGRRGPDPARWGSNPALGAVGARSLGSEALRGAQL